LVNGLVDCTLVAYISGKQSKKAIINALKDPDEDVKQAMAALVVVMLPALLNAKLRTGKTLKDDDGNDYEEEVTLFTFAGRELSRHLLLKLKAARGGATAQAGAKLEEAMESDPSLASLVGGFTGPRKGQTTQEFLFEQLMTRLMPQIEKKVAEKLNSTQGYTQF